MARATTPLEADLIHSAHIPRVRPAGLIGLVWGLGGVLLLLGQAIARLAPLAVEGLSTPLAGWQWGITFVWVVGMAWSEGYKGFQRAFSPRVVGRAFHLARNPRPLHVLLAPLYCMGLVHATRRRAIASWILLATMATLVVLVRQLPQPWRGIVDAGVVVGLVWGVVAIGGFFVRALRGRPPAVPLELPGEVRQARR